jgi:hypothetical protein
MIKVLKSEGGFVMKICKYEQCSREFKSEFYDRCYLGE